MQAICSQFVGNVASFRRVDSLLPALGEFVMSVLT